VTMEPAESVSDPQPSPRLVRKIVCAYQPGIMSGDWLQTWRRLDRLLDRSGFKVKALMEPLDDLPADADLVVVTPDLQEAAEAVVQPGVQVLPTTPQAAASVFAHLIERLTAGTELTAERTTLAERNGPTIVTYRGSQRID